MAQKVSATAFVGFLTQRCAKKDGYIMGATGQNPKTWATNSWWFTQYTGAQKTKALYWRENAERVFDCNGLAEGYYKDVTGVDINTRARNNYAEWCGPKGTGTIPNEYKVPGAAVFIHSSSEGAITHVGYLEKPVSASKPTGDWYVIEAKGVSYGVVRTKLNSRGWNRWGLMTKYFDYSGAAAPAVEYKLGERFLVHGMSGADVKELQTALKELGYFSGSIGGNYLDLTTAAVEKFQKAARIEVDGEYGPITHAALMERMASVSGPVEIVLITGGDVYVRDAPSTDGTELGVAKNGTELLWGGDVSANGWPSVKWGEGKGWVSCKYGKRGVRK